MNLKGLPVILIEVVIAENDLPVACTIFEFCTEAGERFERTFCGKISCCIAQVYVQLDFLLIIPLHY